MLWTSRFITHEKKNATAKNITVTMILRTLMHGYLMMYPILQETEQQMDNVQWLAIQLLRKVFVLTHGGEKDKPPDFRGVRVSHQLPGNCR